MPPGKMAAQAGHAFVEALHASKLHWETATGEATDYDSYVADPPGTKVVLEAPDEFALLRLHEEARQLGIPCALVFDSGHVMSPHFDGGRILTAVGLGPCVRRKVAPLTRRFALVP